MKTAQNTSSKAEDITALDEGAPQETKVYDFMDSAGQLISMVVVLGLRGDGGMTATTEVVGLRLQLIAC